MDFDTCAEFYEDFPSFVTPEYNIDELEEILRSTDANLSSGLGYSFELQPGNSFPSPPASSSNSNSENIKSECDSPTDFNPDDFINFLSDEDADGKSIKSENRCTPSPTNSSSSTVSRDSVSHGMVVDTPPISPPSSIFQLPANILPLTTNPTPINLLQGTLIPVQTLPLTAMPMQNFKTPLKISPKPVDTANGGSKPKTIVLSSKDFKALMQKIQNGKGNGATMPKIIMKSAPTTVQNKKPPVLPKVMPMTTSNVVISEPKASRDLGMFKGIVDERHLKKQQRMIKNRESASLSRKKKKEYVVSLETRINDLEKENTTLKGENTTLRSQLIAFAQTCQCNHNKLSEFITNKFNSNIIGSSSSNGSNFKSRFLSSNMKKNTAVLLAMVFMVSINFGSFQTYLSQDDRMQSSAVDVDVGFHTGRRGLLWVDETGKWNLSNTMDSLNFDGNQTNSSDTDDKCPVSINQTENLRLASELRKWIVVNDFLNLSTVKEKPIGFKLTPEFFELKSVSLPFANSVKQSYKRNRRNFFNRQAMRNKKMQEHPRNSLQLFTQQIDDEYLRLFEGIKRRDDTFYVLSFNSDHILLPAAAYNKSTRPRMSLMLPAGDPSIKGDIRLMQIDCEVVNTTEVHLKPEMVPLNLRPKFNMNTPSSRDILNKTGGGPVQRTARNVVDSAFARKDKPSQFYRPYFMTPLAAEKHRNQENDSRPNDEKPHVPNSATLASIRRRVRSGVNFTFQPESRYVLP